MEILGIILILIPISFLVGFAASTIGYTAWSLIVPLLFVLFGFDIRLVLLVSLLMDCANAIIMTRISIKSEEIDLEIGKRTGIIAIFATGIGVVIGLFILLNNQHLFRGGAGYVNMVLGLIFIIKGINILRNPNVSKEEKAPITDPKKAKTVYYVGSSASAFFTGLIGIGGGMNYVILLMITKGFRIKKATGTAMVITTISTSIAASVFLGNSIFAGLFSGEFILLMLVCILSSAISTMVGAKIAYKLSEGKITVLVGVVVLIAATIATVQNLFLNPA